MRVILFPAILVHWAIAIPLAPILSSDNLSTPPPRIIRTCCSFGADLTIARLPFTRQSDITSLSEIGAHQYLGSKEEGNGNIYTHRGGFIDLGHLRDCADWTAYLYNLIVSQKDSGQPIYLDLGSEGGTKTLTINLPEDIDTKEIAELSGKIAYDLSVWHEIATWFGSSYIPLIPERYSSFSPEDLYSNLLGVHLGIQALQSDLSYEVAMTQLLSSMLAKLEAVKTMEETYEAMESVENIWWNKERSLPSKKILIRRYFDSGEDLTPWLIPDDEAAKTPYVLSKPSFEYSGMYELSIRLNHRFNLKTIYPELHDRVITQKDFDVLLAYIQKNDAVAPL